MNLEFLKNRKAIVLAGAVLVVGVVAGRERSTVELIQENAAERAPRVAAASDADIDLGKLRRGESALPGKDPFVRPVPPAPKQAAQAPQARALPVAPPLPFQYIGKWTEGKKTEVLVMRGEEILSLERGQTLGDYRVEQVGDSAITFTYLPLKTSQTLELPAVN